MSYTEIKKVTPDGDVVGVKQFRNAHGWSAFIYDVLSVKYLGQRPHEWVMQENSDDLWKLVDDPRLEPCERVTLAITYDRAWAMASDVPRVAQALLDFNFIHDTVPSQSRGSVRLLRSDQWDPLDGVAFWGMSVASDQWVVELECPTCGQETDEQRPFNVNEDAGSIRLNFDALWDCRDGDKFVEGMGSKKKA